jgi:hypothetical protein
MSSKNIQNPKPEEKVCWNCKSLIWSVGIGRGIRCSARDGFRMPNSKSYTCEKFQYEVEPVKKGE